MLGVTRLRSLAAVLVLAIAAPAGASPLRLFGYGGRSGAVVGTGAATADDYESLYVNPAGLAHARKRLTAGGLVGDLDLHFDDEPADADLAYGLLYAVATPIPLGGTMADRVGLGVGLYVPQQTLNKAKAPFPGEPTFAIVENAAQVIAIQIATGVRVDERVSVGAGVRVLAALRGSIKILGDPAGRFTTQSEQRTVTSFAPVLGAQYRPDDTWSWGVSVTGESRSDYDIRVTSDLGDAVPLDLPPMRIAGTPQYDPWTVMVEGAYRATPRLSLTGHLAYEHWPAMPPLTRNPVDDASVEPVPDPDYRPTVVPKLAAEWIALRAPVTLTLRGGYAFFLSPAPEQSGRQSLFDNHRHVLGAGVGVDLPASTVPLYIDVWAQLHYLQPRRHTKDLEAFDGDPLPFDTMHTDGTIVAGGLSVGVDL